jgi:hypothetical protein
VSPLIAIQFVSCAGLVTSAAFFSLGSNDTIPELVAMAVFILVLLPAYVLALWRRKFAGFVLVSVALIFTIGATYQLIAKPSGGGPYTRLIVFLLWLIGAPLGLGIFLLRTSRLGWPEVFPKKEDEGLPEV